MKEKKAGRVRTRISGWKAGFSNWESGFERMVPPGVDYKKEMRYFLEGLVLVSISSMIWFSFRFQSFLGDLYRIKSALGNEVLDENALMPDFKVVLGNCLLGFAVLILGAAAMVGYHYLYYFQGSRSIYLMRRLPGRWEYLKRCAALPGLAVLICFATAFLLLLLYFGYYMIGTPSRCLTPNQWQKLWKL